jgi:hypothetical protein
VSYEGILARLRECVRRRHYVVTTHAEEEMTSDGFGVMDVESGVLTGTILEKQRDDVTAENKYRVRGQTGTGAEIELVAKLGVTGKMVIITVYAP